MPIYLDNAASTMPRPEVLEFVLQCERVYANPSSMHSAGVEACAMVNTARRSIAKNINAQPGEIYFTSGGTEANNLALQGVMEAMESRKTHLIVSQIEHPSILNTAKYLESINYDVSYIPVDGNGIVNIDTLENAITENTAIISVMFANNEIGSVQPILKIARLAKSKGVLFHTDAVQAIGHLDIDVDELGIDLMSISGHKIYAPKGVGALYVRRGVELQPLLHGGNQESGLRSGTQNTMGIIGMGKAVELLSKSKISDRKHVCALRDIFVDGLKNMDVQINSPDNGLCNIVNVSFRGVDGEALFNALNDAGVYVSRTCACSSKSGNVSHVLKAIGVDGDLAQSAIRFSFGRYSTEDEVREALHRLGTILDQLRYQAH